MSCFFFTTIKFFKKIIIFFFEKILITFLIFYGLDVNFGFWLIFDQIFNTGFKNYIFSLIFVFLTSYFIFKFLISEKNKNFLLVIIIGLTFYNIGMIVILNNKTDQNFKLTNNNNFLTTKEKRKLIIFLDEMIGYGAINSKSKYGKKALESYQNTFENNGFKLFKNAFSIYPNTVQSIPHSLNFSFKKEDNTNKFTEENFFDRKSKWFIKKK